MYKIYIILIFILISKNYVLCMDAKDAKSRLEMDSMLEHYKTASAQLESLWLSKLEKNKIENEFLSDELIKILKSAVQFIHSTDELRHERKREKGKDSSYLGKKILSTSLFYNIGDVIDRLLALYISLSELEKENPIIAQALHINSSFSPSFRQGAEEVIRCERSAVIFGIVRIKLINSMNRLQCLTENISQRLAPVKGAEYHLKILELLRDIAITFQKEISLPEPTVRSTIKSNYAGKPNKRAKTK